MQEVYLYELYHQLGIKSTYVPSFEDGNEKYVVDAATNLDKLELEQKQQEQKVELDSRPLKPQTYHPPPPKESLLPKKLITVVGSSFLSTTLAVATGAFPSEGRWIERVLSSSFDAGSVDGHVKNPHELVFEDSVRRTASSLIDDWEIQQLSLPLGWKCNETDHTPDLVEALVPEKCYRVDSPSTTPDDPKILEQCRNEIHIAEDSTPWTCGAMCGRDQYNGYALYPERFFVNITSHIEWYLSRGVDITVVLPMRDHSISMKEKLKDDCLMDARAEKDNEMALAIKKEAYKKYGKHGSLLKSGDKERVIAVSYEGLLGLKEVYLFDLYHQLGINSTYSPAFIDDNAKYVTSQSQSNFWKQRFMGHRRGHEKKHPERGHEERHPERGMEKGLPSSDGQNSQSSENSRKQRHQRGHKKRAPKEGQGKRSRFFRWSERPEQSEQ
mmetsp:Transcript_16399/g.29734  ORF Transcript_16399/g.29734 Transcript_16399/m.29734 type:complete len:441 (+) Transcript_16399:2-1324(+)